MFVPRTKSVMVVYPKGYYDVATFLKHTISKHESLDSTLWTIEQYQQNLPTLSGKSYVIFLGSEKDCSIAKPFHDHVESVTYHDGACYAVDGPKALVYGLDVATIESFAESGPNKNYVDFGGSPIDFESAASGTENLARACNKIIGGGLRVTVLDSVFAVVRATGKVKDMLSASDQRVGNTKAASTLFIEKGLSQWLGVDQESDG